MANQEEWLKNCHFDRFNGRSHFQQVYIKWIQSEEHTGDSDVYTWSKIQYSETTDTQRMLDMKTRKLV